MTTLLQNIALTNAGQQTLYDSLERGHNTSLSHFEEVVSEA